MLRQDVALLQGAAAGERATRFSSKTLVLMTVAAGVIAVSIALGVTIAGNNNKAASSTSTSTGGADQPTPRPSAIVSTYAPTNQPIAGTVTTAEPTLSSPSTRSPTLVGQTYSPATLSVSPTSSTPTSASPHTSSPLSTLSPTPQAGASTNQPVSTGSPVLSPGCSGGACTPPNCRSSSNFCGLGSAWCNAQSTWTPSCLGGTTASPVATTMQPSMSSSSTSSPITGSPTTTANPTTKSPSLSASPTTSDTTNIADLVAANCPTISANLLQVKMASGSPTPSTVYKCADMVSALRVAMAGIAGSALIGTGIQGRLNVAAFIGESMAETIMYDACDENNWDFTGSLYPSTNACGQLGQNYSGPGYTCDAADAAMDCTIDPSMQITGVTHATWWGAPPPFYCAPTSVTGPYTPPWDSSATCNNPPTSTCNAYPGQAGGNWGTGSYASKLGALNVQGCCWWGRGVIQLTGSCNMGRLNYFLGAKAQARGLTGVPYPDVDFCTNPEAICTSTKYPELKWISGLYYWLTSVQAYNAAGQWNFVAQLNALALTPTDSTARANFLNAVSGIVNRGCWNPPCGTGALDNGAGRLANFEAAWAILGAGVAG